MSVININAERRIPFVFDDDDHWTEFDRKDEFLPLVDPIDYQFNVSNDTTIVKIRPINFYADACALKVSDPTWGEEWKHLSVYFLYSSGQYYQVSSGSETMETLNDALTITLNKRNIIDYIKFVSYFFYRDPEYGASCVIEGKDSEFIELLPYSNKLEQQRNKEKVKEPIIAGPDQAGVFEVTCDVMLALDLVRAELKIDADGYIEMLDNKIIVPGHYPAKDKEEESNNDTSDTNQE